MSRKLADVLREELATPAPAAVTAFARALADRDRDAAVLFYGSSLRTGELTGLLDFYRLTNGAHRRGGRRLLESVLWPEVSYHELEVDGVRLRAKVATLPLATFHRAASGRTLDTTIWARFAQPAALAWCADEWSALGVADAVAAAVQTAARYAAVLGPASGPAEAFWTALFRRTYATEFRVEGLGRADEVLGAAAGRYAELLPLAWSEIDLPFRREGDMLTPELGSSARGVEGSWAVRQALGKPLNVARLLKAAFTFDGAARYAAWKIERHTGVAIEVTPFRERHPILAAPRVLWRLRAARRQAEARRAGAGSSPNV